MYTLNFPENREAYSNPKYYQVFRYPGGEAQVRFKEDALYKMSLEDKIRVIARITTGEIMELALLSDALVHHFGGTKELELVLPYLPYGRADRRFVQGDCFGLKVFGELIDNLKYDRVTTIDAHSSVARQQIANLVNIDPHIFIDRALDSIGPATVLLPDEGAKRYGFGYLYCEKIRDVKTGIITGVKVPPKKEFGKNVLIIDDICDGGATFIAIADAMKSYNKNLYLYVTHGIFSKGFVELEKRFKTIFTTDSFKEFPLKQEQLEVFSIGELLR